MGRVAGSVIAESVTVKLHTNWPDYVFKPTYQLKLLSEVKTYIDQNHHLPDMPSEKEIADKGLDLGEMNKLLTKKVEELTLYLIEKDKKDQDQQKEIDELKKQVQNIIANK
jgi:response regulator of citrate/malate metabolism